MPFTMARQVACEISFVGATPGSAVACIRIRGAARVACLQPKLSISDTRIHYPRTT